MTSPYASGEIWKTFIQQPTVLLLQDLLHQAMEARQRDPNSRIPTIKVDKNAFCLFQQKRAPNTFGTSIPFPSLSLSSSSGKISADSQAEYISMTVLQYSIMCLSTSLIEDADQRKQVIEILVKAFTSNEITQDVFADGNNALHLAAFLNLESTLHLLIAHGCDPTIKNGQGLSALDLLFATKADQLDSVYSESKSFNYCSIKDSTEQSSKTISGIEGASDENDSVSTIGRGSSLRSERFSSSESIIPHQLFASCTAPAAAFIIDTAIHTNHKHKASVCCNSSSSTHNTTRFESIHINDSVERDIYSVPQISQLTFDSSTEDPTKSLIFEKNGNFYDHDHSDLGVKSNGDSSDIRQATDGIDASNLYSFQNEHEKQQYTSKQHDVIELDGTNDELHKDLSCFLRIRSNGIIQSNSKTYLISILKNHHAWKPTNLSIEHFQSHNAYETYISSLGLHRSFDNSYNRHAMHKKSVQWNTIKQVREYQSSTSGHPSDNWDEYYTSEPYENAVEDNIAPTVSPYDIVRPVTPARYRRHSISLNLNNSYIDISNPAKTMIPRPLPDIPQSDNEPAKSSLAGYHKITPPPFSFLSKSKATNNTMSKSIASQTDEQTHLLSSHSSSRRISKSILPWNSKHLVSPVNKTSFFNISCHSQPSKLHKYYDGISSESANILGYQETTETSVAPPITDSSLCVPRTLRSLTPLPGTVPKSYNYEILKTSQFTSKAHTAEEILRQNTPFSTSSEVQDHSKSSIMLELTGNTTKYDSMDPLIPYSSWCSSKTTYSSANMKPKIFTHFKSALREKFGVSPLSSRSSSSAPRCLSSSSLGSKLCVNEVDDKSMGLPALAYTVNRNDSFDGVVNNHLSVVNDGKEVSDRALINQQDCMPLFRITNTQDNTIHPDIPHATSLPDELPQPYLTAPISEYNPSIIDYIQNIGTGVRHGEQDNTSLHQSDALSNDHQVFSTSSGKYSSCLSADTSSPAPGWSVSIEKRENPDISESFSCKSSPQSTISKCSQMHRSRDEPIKSSMPYNSNWIKNKEIALALSKMVYPASNSLPDIALANHGCNRSITDQELASYEIPITNTIDELKAKTVGVAKPCALLDLSPQSQSKALAKITDYSPLQQKDIHANYCQDRLTEPVKLSNMTKPHYVLPELSFVTKSPVKMEYVHGITHDTCSTILGSQDDSIKESFLESTLVNIQGISRGLKSQKYNLRQSIIVERYSDTELQSLSQTFPLVETSFHPSDHEQHSSLWMDLTEYESQPRRTTLSSCDSPMNFETGVLYLRLKRICNFSLRLPEEPTMISIRIDTGCEKVDTDYVPLKDIDTVFNQEFCLPVYPGLAITITLHLMQAPHLQPRFQLQSQANTPLLPLHNVESSGEHMPDKQHLSQSSFTLLQATRAHPTPHHCHQQQMQSPYTSTIANVFYSFGRKSRPRSIFQIGRHTFNPVSGTNTTSTIKQKVFRSGIQQPSFLTSDKDIHLTAIGTDTSIIQTRSRGSNCGTLSATSAAPLPLIGSRDYNHSSSSEFNSIISPPAHSASSITFAVQGKSIQQYSTSSLSLTASASTSTSQSTLLSSCDSSRSTLGEGQWRHTRSKSITKWGKGLLSIHKKHQRLSQSQGSLQTTDNPTPFIDTFNGRLLASVASRTRVERLKNSMEQLQISQEHWDMYWKGLDQKHRQDPTGSSTNRTFSRQSMNSESHSTKSSLATGAPSLSSHPPGFVFPQKGSDIEFTPLTPNDNDTLVPFLTQLTRDGIYETESPLEILSRHILFDDELCIGRTGIVFNDIRPACTDQIVNIEFQAVNSWVDLNDYSQVRGQLGRISSSILTKDTIQCDATDSGHDDSDSSGDGDELGEEMDKSKGDIAIANIEATVCFIPGPEMDPEDAAFGEPQNLVDCHLGLKYFQWQKQISFCGELYYSSSMFANTRSRKHIESPAKWIEGRFCIIGSMLWQYYPRSPSYSPRVIQKDEQGLEDDEDGKEKRWRCLDLSLVHGIETNQGYFSARARFLDEMDDHSNLYENEEQVSYADNRSEQPKCSSPEHYLVRNGFRLCIASEKEGSVDPQKKKKTMCDMAFYAETAEASQQWVSALLETCRERPPRPYWMV